MTFMSFLNINITSGPVLVSFLDMSSLSVIVITSKNYFQHECSCGKKLATSQALGSHQATCAGIPPPDLAQSQSGDLFCSICEKPFTNKSGLASHLRSKKHKVQKNEFSH